MKFGKEFSSQMVPEWQEAYVDYNNLKSLLKNVQTYKRNARPAYSPSGITRKLSLYRAFSGLTQRKSHVRSPTPSPDVEMPPIVVNSNVRNHGEDYETRFLMTADEGGEYELVYFRRLDDEFNKVNKFYKSKVDEVVKEAELLNTQMDAFIAFRIRVENNQGPFDRSAELNRLASDIAVSSAAMSASTPAGARANRRVDLMDIIEEGPSIHGDGDQMNESTVSDKNEATETAMTSREQVHKPKKGSVDLRPAPLDILNKVTFHNHLETPRSTIKGVLNVPNRTELVFNRRNLRKVENKLKVAFIEFYQKLRLLKSYSFMNTLAFSKIMKKYDKITTRNASKSYLSMVDTSFLGSSDDVTKLMERVEKTFIKHFCNSNRTKGISILRPKDKREKHRTSFSVGFFAGGTVAFIVALIFIIRAHKIMDQPGQTKYMETLFPLYSLFAFMVLHIIMYAINIFYWRRYRVNHSFIFGFKQGAELSYRDVFLIAFVVAVIALATVLSNLDMEMNPTTKDYNAFSELLPLLVVVVLIVILICPFNIIHRPSRYFFLTCVFHCICAPFYKVTLPDFFLADQMTSQVQAIRSLEFYICYYGFGDYKHREHKCNKDSQVFEVFFFIVAVIPYWSRFLQCLRRLFEEKDAMQGYNGLKYFSTIVAVCLRTAYSFYGGIAWKVAAAAVSVLSAVVCTYWDLVLDWGLLQRDSKNRWLRDKLLVPQKNIYFAAMGLNVLLRFAWIQTVLNFQFTFMHKNTLTTVVACLEIIRRGIWNFFRLENEHLNNVGKYRAFKSVPLPFNYDEDGDKDE